MYKATQEAAAMAPKSTTETHKKRRRVSQRYIPRGNYHLLHCSGPKTPLPLFHPHNPCPAQPSLASYYRHSKLYGEAVADVWRCAGGL